MCALHAAPSAVDDRILIGLQGESLTNTSGGGGGSVGWLHNFDAATLAGLGVEHQMLANSHWTFGSLNASHTMGQGSQRYTVYGEAHEGGGNSGDRALNYHIEAVGLVGTYFSRLSVSLEDRQFFVDTVSGNLPKLGVSYLWNPHVQTTVVLFLLDRIESRHAAGVGQDRRVRARRELAGRLLIRAGHRGGADREQQLEAWTRSLRACGSRGLCRGDGAAAAAREVKSASIVDYQKLSNPSVDSNRFQGNLNYVFHIGHHGT